MMGWETSDDDNVSIWAFYAQVATFSVHSATHCCNENFMNTCTLYKYTVLFKQDYLYNVVSNSCVRVTREHTFQTANDHHERKQEQKAWARLCTYTQKPVVRQPEINKMYVHTLAFCFHFIVVVVLQFSMLCSWHFRIGNVSGNSSLYTLWMYIGFGWISHTCDIRFCCSCCCGCCCCCPNRRWTNL